MSKGCLSGLPHARLQLACRLPIVTVLFDYLDTNINLVRPVKEQKKLERWTDCYVVEFVSPPSPEATVPEMNADQPHRPRQWRHPMLPSIKRDTVKNSVCIPLMSCSALCISSIPPPLCILSPANTTGEGCWRTITVWKRKGKLPNYLGSLRGN